MDYQTQRRDEMHIMGIAVRTTNADNQAMGDIANLWERFAAENIFAKIPNRLSDEVYGLYTDYESDHTAPYTLVIGCQVEPGTQAPEGLEVRTVPAATYAAIQAKGPHPQTLIGAWIEVWASDLDRRYSGDLEVYGPGFQNDPPEIELFIAVQTRIGAVPTS